MVYLVITFYTDIFITIYFKMIKIFFNSEYYIYIKKINAFLLYFLKNFYKIIINNILLFFYIDTNTYFVSSLFFCFHKINF